MADVQWKNMLHVPRFRGTQDVIPLTEFFMLWTSNETVLSVRNTYTLKISL